MDVIALMVAEHDEIAGMFDQVQQHRGDATPALRGLVIKLALLVKTHARSEEKVLYEALRTTELRSFALEGKYEHELLELVIDRLVGERAGDEMRAIARVARDLFEHHARTEEEELVLPRLAVLMCAEERATIGYDMVLEKLRITPLVERAISPRDVIPVRRLNVNRWH